MADLNINNEIGFIEIVFNDIQKTIYKPFNVKLNDDVVIMSSSAKELDYHKIIYPNYNNIYVDDVLQSDISTLYSSLKNSSIKAGDAVSIVDEESGVAAKVNDSGQILVVLDGKVDDNNTTTITLDADETFTGEATETLDYAIINIAVFSDVDSAEDGLCFQFSSDGLTNWRTSECYTINADTEKSFSTQAIRSYFRIIYTNSTTAQITFDLQTIFKKTNSKDSSHRISDDISGEDDATLVKAVLTGLNPNDVFKNVNLNVLGNLLVSLDEQKDAFGRLKTADPYTIFDSSLTTLLADTLFWSELINGTATSTYDRTTSKKTLNTLDSGDYIVRQTKKRFKYQPAKSHEFFITGLWSTETGQRKRAGLCDYDNVDLVTITNTPQNGIFFENNEGVISWNIANNGVITESATQSEWNIDACDGSGRSAFNFEPDAVNILTCQLEWLGVGVVLVGFAIGAGSVVYCHGFAHASNLSYVDVYMRTANLPISYEITSITGSGSLKAICSSVISGGGFNPIGDTDSIYNTTSISVSSGDTELLIGLRLQEDYFEHTVEPKNISILTTSNGDTQWFLCLNPVYTGTVTFADKDNSVIQQAENNDNQVTDFGKIITAGSFSNNVDGLTKDIQTTLRAAKDLYSNRDELWLVVTALGNEDYRGTINFKQLI